MDNKKTEKIKIIELKDKFLYNIDRYLYKDSCYMNGEKMQETFEERWYVCKDKPYLFQEKSTIRVNEKWELINKELYNETLPLIIDEHSQEKYKALTTSDLYNYTYEKKEILTDIPLKIVEYIKIDEDVPIEHSEFIQTEVGWHTETKEAYLINQLKFSIQDNCLVPSPIKELTKPCILPKKMVYNIITNYIIMNIDLNVAKVKDNYSFTLRIVSQENEHNEILELYNGYDHHSDTFKDLYGKNYKELVEKLDRMKKGILDYVNKSKVCPHCKGRGLTTKEFNVENYY